MVAVANGTSDILLESAPNMDDLFWKDIASALGREETISLLGSDNNSTATSASEKVWCTPPPATSTFFTAEKYDDLIATEERTAEDEALDLALAADEVDDKALGNWASPVLFDAPMTLPEFPIDALPDYVVDFVRDIAGSYEVHPDLPAVFALGLGASASQKKFRVNVRGDHYEPLNLFVLAALPPAERKSAVLPRVISPLLDFEKTLQDRERENIQRAKEKYLAEEERRKKLREERARAKDPEVRETLMRELEELATALREPPEPPRLTASGDILPEVLAALLNGQGGSMTIYDPEGGVLFGNVAGRYQNGTPNFEILLKAHAGDSVQVDRIGRPGIFVSHPCLTVILAVQPDVVRQMAKTPQFKARGLAARFLYSFPQPMTGRRTYDACVASDSVFKKYAMRIRAAIELPAALDDNGKTLARVLRFSDEAYSVQREMAIALEKQMLDGEPLYGLKDWAGKAAGAAARIAGILHILEHAPHAISADSADSAPIGLDTKKESFPSCSCKGHPELLEVSATTVVHAWKIVNYFKDHARHAYALFGADEVEDMARRILAWVKQERLERFTHRDCHNRFRSVGKSAALDGPLSILADRGFVRRLPEPERPSGKSGRSPSPSYEVNPLWA